MTTVDADDIEMQAKAASKEASEYSEVSTKDEPHDDLYEEEMHGHEWSIHGVLYYFRKILNYQSIRDIQYAIQFAGCFVIAAVIAYMTNYSTKTSSPYLLPLMAPMTMGDTVGGTFMACIMSVFSFVPTCVFMFILMKCGMGYHDYTSSTILFFFTCFVLGYINPTVATRKMALLLPAVFFVTIVNTPAFLIPDDFVWQLLEVVLVALCVDLAVCLTVLPRFACLEVQDRYAYALGRNQEVLELALQAMLSTQRAKAEVFICEANAIINHINANHEAMTARCVPAKIEPVALVRWLFRSKQTVFNSYSMEELRQISAFLGWHVIALVHAAKHMHFNEYHSVASEVCRDSFLTAITEFKGLIRLLRCRVHNKTHINAKIVELKRALDHMHAVLSGALKKADRVAPRDETTFASSLSDTTDEGQDTVRGVLFEGDARKEANRLTFSYFLFHMSELIQTVENKFWTDEDGHVSAVAESIKIDAAKPKPPLTPASLLLRVVLIPYYVVAAICKSLATDWQTKTKVGLRTAFLLGVALIFAEVPKLVMRFENGQWIMFAMLMSQGDNLGGTFYVMRNRFLGTLTGAVFGYFVYLAVQSSYRHIIAMYVPYLLLCGLVKQNKQWSYYGSISATTGLIITFGRNPFLAPIVGDYSLLRIQENVIGILLSLTCQLLSDPVFASDLLKVNIVRLFQQFSAASNTMANAYVNTVTEADVSSSSKKGSGAGDESPSGVAAVTYLDVESTMVELGIVEAAKRDTKIKFIGPLVVGIKTGIMQQPLLIEQASMETVFWSKALPESTYLQLIHSERKMLHELVTIDRALLRISKISRLRAAEHFVMFGKSISKDVTTLLEQVSANVTLWSTQIRATVWHDTTPEASQGAAVRSNHRQTRNQHIAGLEGMDQSAKAIAKSGAHFNNHLMKQWMDEVIPKLSTEIDQVGATEASIHHMYDIMTAFNALFYASSHLAMATSELGNTVFMILLLERKKSHKPF